MNCFAKLHKAFFSTIIYSLLYSYFFIKKDDSYNSLLVYGINVSKYSCLCRY